MKEPSDPSCRRVLLKFSATKGPSFNGIPFIQFEIEGQSFLLNQIRKMIAFISDLSRDELFEESTQIISSSFSEEFKYRVHKVKNFILIFIFLFLFFIFYFFYFLFFIFFIFYLF